MNGQGLSSSYPPTYSTSATKRSRARPRKNPHPLTTRSLPHLQYTSSGTPPSSGHRDTLPPTSHCVARHVSKKNPQFQGTAADQVVPLDFSVRSSKKRSSIVAFGSNESDTENTTVAALTMATGADAAVMAQMLHEHERTTLNDHLRAQLQAYFNLQQQQLQEQLDSENCTGHKKQRQDSGDTENDLQWADLHVAASASCAAFRGAFKEQRTPRRKSIVNSVPIGLGRSMVVARRRSNASKHGAGAIGAMGRVQSRPCSVNNSLNGQTIGNNSGVDAAAACDCSRQQIFVNYELIIDEHFRRSLGSKKYRELFPSAKSSRSPSTSSTDEDDDEDEPVEEVTLD